MWFGNVIPQLTVIFFTFIRYLTRWFRWWRRSSHNYTRLKANFLDLISAIQPVKIKISFFSLLMLGCCHLAVQFLRGVTESSSVVQWISENCGINFNFKSFNSRPIILGSLIFLILSIEIDKYRCSI